MRVDILYFKHLQNQLVFFKASCAAKTFIEAANIFLLTMFTDFVRQVAVSEDRYRYRKPFPSIW